tara:strand:+ start:155 stop:886 length:732 start_codon:yes stop_codon:yes gene_type:complete
MMLKDYKTSLSVLRKKNDKSFSSKLLNYLINPQKIFSRLLWEINKYDLELNWHDRVSEMGNSAVFASNVSIKEQKKLTKIHEKMILKVLKNKLKKKAKLLDFGCGYGRFKNLFEKKLFLDYLGVEKENLFLNNLNKKKFLKFDDFKRIKKFNNYFDLIFVWEVLGGFNDKNIKQIIKILKKKLSKNGIICFVDIVSKKEKQEVGWRFRTVDYYKSLFNGYSINSDYYFFEDSQKKVFFLISKN